MKSSGKPICVVGASGLVGTAACLEFKQAGWRVIAASRRVPELLEGRGIEHLALYKPLR